MGPKAKPEKKKEIPEAMTEPRNLRNVSTDNSMVCCSLILLTEGCTRHEGQHSTANYSQDKIWEAWSTGCEFYNFILYVAHFSSKGEANPHNVTTNEPVPLEVNTPNIPQGLSEGNSLDMDVQAEPTSSTHNNAEVS